MWSRLGVDSGGVIVDRANDKTPTSSFGDNFLEARPSEYAFEALATINASSKFRCGVWVVSKCGKRMEDRTKAWQRHNRFHEQTGIPPENVHFTRERIGKVAIARSLELTHFIDDRLEVLNYLADTVQHLYLFNPDWLEVAAHQAALPRVTVVKDWHEVLEKVLIA